MAAIISACGQPARTFLACACVSPLSRPRCRNARQSSGRVFPYGPSSMLTKFPVSWKSELSKLLKKSLRKRYLNTVHNQVPSTYLVSEFRTNFCSVSTQLNSYFTVFINLYITYLFIAWCMVDTKTRVKQVKIITRLFLVYISFL